MLDCSQLTYSQMADLCRSIRYEVNRRNDPPAGGEALSLEASEKESFVRCAANALNSSCEALDDLEEICEKGVSDVVRI